MYSKYRTVHTSVSSNDTLAEAFGPPGTGKALFLKGCLLYSTVLYQYELRLQADMAATSGPARDGAWRWTGWAIKQCYSNNGLATSYL